MIVMAFTYLFISSFSTFKIMFRKNARFFKKFYGSVYCCNTYFRINLCYSRICLLYTSDAADEEDSVDLGGRRIIKKNLINPIYLS